VTLFLTVYKSNRFTRG